MNQSLTAVWNQFVREALPDLRVAATLADLEPVDSKVQLDAIEEKRGHVRLVCHVPGTGTLAHLCSIRVAKRVSLICDCDEAKGRPAVICLHLWKALQLFAGGVALDRRALRDVLDMKPASVPSPSPPPSPATPKGEPKKPEGQAAKPKRRAASDSGATPLKPGMPVDDVLAWAIAAGVHDEATRHARVLDSTFRAEFSGSMPFMGNVTVAQVVQRGSARSTPRKLTGIDKEISQVAIDHLLKVAREQEQVASEEQELLAAKALADEPRQQAVERLLALRSKIRAHSQPLARSRAEVKGLDARLDPPGAVVSFRQWPTACTTYGEAARVVVGFGSETAAASLSCHCANRRPECRLQLLGLDVAIEALRDTATKAHVRAWKQELARPAWQRHLTDLQKRLAELPPPPSSESLPDFGWQLTFDRASVEIRGLVCEPQPRGGGVGVGVKTKVATAAELEQRQRTDPNSTDAFLAGVLLGSGTRGKLSQSTTAATASLIRRLVGHPRVFMAREGARKPVPVRVRTSSLTLRVDDPSDERGEGRLRLQFSIDGIPVAVPIVTLATRRWMKCTEMVLDDGDTDTLWIVPQTPAHRAMSEWLAERGQEMPLEALSPLTEHLSELSQQIDVDVSGGLAGSEAPPAASPTLTVRIDEQGSLTAHSALRLDGQTGRWWPGRGAMTLFRRNPDGVQCQNRDTEGERTALHRLGQTLRRPELGTAPYHTQIDDLDEGLGLIEALQAADIEVDWAQGKVVAVAAASTSAVSLRIQSAREWLELGGSLSVESRQVPLQELLLALRLGRRYVRMSEHHWVRMTEELVDALSPLARASEPATAAAAPPKLHRFAAGLLDDASNRGLRIEGSADWRNWLDLLRRAATATPELPPTLNATLRDYQAEGVRWLLRLSQWAPGACLADDMGLGKTVQSIAVLLARAERGKALVVAPTSVIFNWLAELERFAPTLRVRAIRTGAESAALQAPASDMLDSADVFVTSWGVFANNAEPFQAVLWRTAVLDEAHAIKNPRTARAQAARQLQAEFAIGLTGTPIENRTTELWSLFHVLVPGLLGSERRFRDRFALPIERNRHESARHTLARLVQPFLLRRLKRDVATELPPRTDIRLDIVLDPPTRALYDAVRAKALEDLTKKRRDEEKTRFHVLAALTRLRQIACHPRLVEENAPTRSAKVRVLVENLEELRDEGHRALVFSQFPPLLRLVSEELDAARISWCYLDGATPAAQRQAQVEAFQNGRADVFLLSVKAGGVGLNLTAADYVFHLDPWWNPAVEDQATDRAHRLGQDNPVTVYRLVARDTVEETILALHDKKRALVEGVLQGEASGAPLSSEELLAILRAGQASVAAADVMRPD